MLANSDPDYEYQIYVLHSDISPENQEKLEQTVAKFANSSLHFARMHRTLSWLFEQTGNKAHFSEEIYYKFLAPSVLFRYDKAIIADVDVIYLGDVSKSFLEFDTAEPYYLAAQPAICPN